MDFDCASIKDEPYDFELMASVVDAYDETITVPQWYNCVYDGSHLYYRYQAQLLEILSTDSSVHLRSSLRLLYESVRACLDEIDGTPLPREYTTVDVSSIQPIPSSDAVLLKIWEKIFDLLLHHTLLVLRQDPLALSRFASVYELYMCVMIAKHSLCHIVRGVRYSNWPIFPYNCFLHILDNVEVVVVEGTTSLSDNCSPPAVPCPFLLPSSIKELRLSKVSLDDYSIEGMLLPAGHLQHLSIENIDAGHLCIPPVFLPRDYHDLQDGVGLTSFRWPYTHGAHPPSLQYLKLDMVYDIFGTVTERYGWPEPTDDGFALLHQLFGTETGVESLEFVLEDGETYPLQTCVSSMEELDLHVSTRTNTGGMGSPISLAGLDVLHTLIICSDYEIVHQAVTVMSTWGSLSCSSPDSVFELWLHSDTYLPFLHLHWNFVFGLRGSVDYPIADIDFEIAQGIVIPILFNYLLATLCLSFVACSTGSSLSSILLSSQTAPGLLRYIYTKNESFTLNNAWDLLDLIDSVEMDFTVFELVESYRDGSHLYFCFQSSMIDLVSKDGNVFYASLLQFMRNFECKHSIHFPSKDSDPPSCKSDPAVSSATSEPFKLPPELLECVFLFVPVQHLFAARYVSHYWCASASHFTHSKIIFRMPTNWQHFIGTDDAHKHEAEAYALVAQLALICAATHWRFQAWIHTLISENWPEICVPFFFRVLKNALISLCINLMFLSVIGMHYSHIVVGPLTPESVQCWRENCGIAMYLRDEVVAPSVPTLMHMCIDFPDKLPHVLSLETDIDGTPPLLKQMFVPSGSTSCVEPFLEAPSLHSTRYSAFALDGFSNVSTLEVSVPVRALSGVLCHCRPNTHNADLVARDLIGLISTNEANSYRQFNGELHLTLVFPHSGDHITVGIASFESTLQLYQMYSVSPLDLGWNRRDR
ncbi:hypothetical protein ARMSODRAFT_978518 [Armillaria solidipes]|uniref:F-box domain-containing protein n=1 Tax=Armillaria solidipes TaxID=1076256 RepID=A0A2H3BKM2_9AGAR|nr:hypothetical protein ARMSODRAFT_978518 [Armillaria solidipes]